MLAVLPSQCHALHAMVTRTIAGLPARTVHMPKLAPQLTHVRLEGAHDDGDVICLRRQPVNTPHSS